MGWDGHGKRNRETVLAEISKPQTWTYKGVTTALTPLETADKGAEVWQVVRVENTQADGAKIERVEIRLTLFEKQGGEICTKTMGESSHPYYYGCPLKFLDMVPCPDSDYAWAWRAEVRRLANERNESNRQTAATIRKLKIGNTVRIIGASDIAQGVIVSLKPLAVNAGGVNYKLPRKMLGEVIG